MAVLDKKLQDIQLEDINLKVLDQAIVKWFSEDYPIVINGVKTPVIYATAERWARAQNQKGFRDESGVLILPLVSIRRTTPSSIPERYAPEHDETNITLMRRVATLPTDSSERQPAQQGWRLVDKGIRDIHGGTFFTKTADETVYEILQIPFPSFVNLNYEVVIWTSYMTHQNLQQENIYQEFRGGRQWFFYNNYFFYGTLVGSGSDRSNLDEFSEKEKIIKYSFTLLLQAYLIDRSKVKSYRTSSNVRMTFKETSFPLK